MLRFITILLLTQTELKTRGTVCQITFKRQVIGFDSSGALRVKNNGKEDNSNDFTNQGIKHVHHFLLEF